MEMIANKVGSIENTLPISNTSAGIGTQKQILKIHTVNTSGAVDVNIIRTAAPLRYTSTPTSVCKGYI